MGCNSQKCSCKNPIHAAFEQSQKRAIFPISPNQKSSVQEVAQACEDHGEAKTVASGDNVGVADGTSRLDKGIGAGLGGFFDPVGKWEKRVGSNDAAFERRLRFH